MLCLFSTKSGCYFLITAHYSALQPIILVFMQRQTAAAQLVVQSDNTNRLQHLIARPRHCSYSVV